MPRIDRWMAATALLGTLVGTARGQAPTPAPARSGAAAPAAAARPDPARAARMAELLQRWEEVSRGNESLYAAFTRTDQGPTIVGSRVFRGQALLRKPNLACIEFYELANDGSKKEIFDQRIVCTGESVFQFLGPTKQVFVYPISKDAQRRDVEEGPLPFLFNMRVDEATRRYSWELKGERPATPAQPAAAGRPAVPAKPATWIIQIVPREAIDKEEFATALVILDQTTFLPQALRLYAPNGKDTKTFEFTKVERNGARNPASVAGNFDGPAMARDFEKRGYKVIVNPDGTPGAGAAAGSAPAAAAAAPARAQGRR